MLAADHSSRSVPTATAYHSSGSVPSMGSGSQKWPSPFPPPPPPQSKKHPASWCGYRKTGSIVFTWDSLGGPHLQSSLWGALKLLLQISTQFSQTPPAPPPLLFHFLTEPFRRVLPSLLSVALNSESYPWGTLEWQPQTEARGTRVDLCLVRPKVNPMSCFCHCCLGFSTGSMNVAV